MGLPAYVFVCTAAKQTLIVLIGVLDLNPVLSVLPIGLVNLNPTVMLYGQSVAFMKRITFNCLIVCIIQW